MAVVTPLKLVYTPVDDTVTAIRNYQVPSTRLAPEHFSAARVLDARTHTASLAHQTTHSRRTASATSCAWCDLDAQRLHLRVERPRRTAVHFFPHTRPPDTHSHLSQQHTTPPLDRGAAVEYQGPLVNTYSSLALSSMPGNRQRRNSRRVKTPPRSLSRRRGQ